MPPALRIHPDQTVTPARRALIVRAEETPLVVTIAQSLGVRGYEVRSCDAAAAVESPARAELVLLVQDRPGQFPRTLPGQLIARFAGARLLSIAGSWCEGELRTGTPWQDVERIYWYDLDAWLNRGIEQEPSRRSPRGVIGIDCTRRETASAIADALVAEPLGAVWLPRRGRRPLVRGLSAGVWVGAQLDGRAASSLGDFNAELRETSTPVVAMLDFPRHDEWRLAESLGVAALLAKPWSIDALLRTLNAVIEVRNDSQRCHRRGAA
ncbi:MAG: hypothetical protein AAF589_04435 [Planctomycetota bacterium]